MPGINKGSTYTETFGSASPVTAAIPTGALDGQPLDGLSAVSVFVQAPPGGLLTAGGVCRVFLLSRAACPADGKGLFLSASYINGGATASFNWQSSPFQVGQLVTGQTSQAYGTIATGSVGANSSGSLNLTSVSGTFSLGEQIYGVSPGEWATCPSNDFLITTSGSRQQCSLPFECFNDATARMKVVPFGATYTPGLAGGITIVQVGQTYLYQTKAGKP